MESIYTKLALYGSKLLCARTDTVFLPIFEVCDGLRSAMVLLSTELDGYPIVYLTELQNPNHVVNKVLDQFQVQGIFFVPKDFGYSSALL